MLIILPFDIASPGLLAATAGIGLLILCGSNVMIIGIESIVLWRLKWGSFKRAALGAIVMNIATSVIGIGIVPFTMQLYFWGLLIDFALSILIEGGILLLFKRDNKRATWLAALAANSASYLLVILPLYLFFGLLR